MKKYAPEWLEEITTIAILFAGLVAVECLIYNYFIMKLYIL